MNVAVFGLGYVGCVSAACLRPRWPRGDRRRCQRRQGRRRRDGRSPVIEPGLDDLIREMVGAGRLRATLDVAPAVHQSDVSLICVGTPSNGNGSLEPAVHPERVPRDRRGAGYWTIRYHVVVVRSTVLPGTVQDV